jgi:epsilon-lactone hydrolase
MPRHLVREKEQPDQEDAMSKQQRALIDERLRSAPFDTTASPAQQRLGFEQFAAGHGDPAGVALTDTELGGRPALRFDPTDRPARDGVLLYFHGGGWVVGSPRATAALTAQLVTRTGLPAWSVDYRLAPEHPFPAAIDDGVAAYRALLESGTPADRIVLAGDSAGGGLAITTMLAARDAGLPLPAAAVTFSAGLDATRSGATMETKAGIDPLFTRESLGRLTAHYSAGQDLTQPLLSPAVSADPTGLPPLLLQAGSNEVLLDDSVRFAARAAAAGVDVQLDVTGDVPHVFQLNAGELDEADRALDRAGRFLLEHLDSAGR